MTQKPKSEGRAQELKDAVVRQLPVPEQGHRIYWDATLGGFGVRVTAAGARSYVLDYRTRGGGRQRRYTIGAAEDWTTVAARTEARRLRRSIDDGGDPLADLEAEREAPTMVDLIKRFREEHMTRKRPATASAYDGILSHHIEPHFGQHVKVAEVQFEDVDALHRKISKAGSPYVANRTVAVLSKMFSLAIKWRMRSDNPAKGIERNAEAKRKRYLTGDELPRLVQALATHSDQQSANIVRLLLLTGCRRGEALAARWADLDLSEGVWTKSGSTTKQKTDHTVPLSAPARQLLSEIQEQQLKKRRTLGEYVFPSESATGYQIDIKKSWASLCRAAKLDGLRIHDLRHSYASQLASGGASLPLIGALLGHSNPATTARYAHLFQDPQRAAAEKIGAIITAAANRSGAEPTPFKRRPRG
jgi:integrase